MDVSQLDISMLFEHRPLSVLLIIPHTTYCLTTGCLGEANQPTCFLFFFVLVPPEPSVGRFLRGRCAPARQGAQA
eukprot:5334243-Prorocentrum_lima.AAC.1